MQVDHEAELLLIADEGLLSRAELEALRAEAREQGRSPLEMLRERGRISEETRASLLERLSDPSATLELGQPGPASASDAPAFPIPGWDRYQPIRFLGQGGMGRVFLAYDPRLRRPVALKFVRDEDGDRTRRFISEARAQARVRHERVCQVHEVGHQGGTPFIAMQYVDGQPLGALVRALTVEQKALVLREAALGVHAAHRAGLIHRDLKPSNILVERAEDGTLRPYVMDFGLARDWNNAQTATGAVLGTPHYMAPEQARGEAGLDRRADVYALGATLYHLLTGQQPIPGANGLEVLNNIPTVEPRPPRLLDPNIPADLEAIALKCLEKDRSARYGSARALAEDLDRFIAGEPVLARPGLGYRLRKRLRKHRLLASTGAAALLAVGAALGWGLYTRRQAAERERIALRFSELVERIESMARYSALARAHDIREDRRAIQARMAELEAEIQRGGAPAVGPGQYALGRGWLALGDDAKAGEFLESAWRSGFHDPRAAYALALVTGRRYQRQLLEAQRIRTPALREARMRDAERLFRDPALEWLKRSEGAQVPSAEYVAALLAFYEGRLDDALTRLDGAGHALAWFHELSLLRGELLETRAYRRWNAGDLEGARADFEAGRKACEAAATTAESEPLVYQARARLEGNAMAVELYGRGDVMPAYTRALGALARCLEIAPDDAACLVQLGGLHHRLAEHRLNQGGDVAEPLGKALEATSRARTLDPRRSEATLQLARSTWLDARFRMDRGGDPRPRLREAAALFESVRPEDRDRAYHVDSGLVFKTWADYEDQISADSRANRDRAIQAYQAAIALDERMPSEWINLGVALLARASLPRNAEADRDLARALEELERARALNPQHVVPYFYAGQVHERAARRQRNRGEDPRPDLDRALDAYRQGLAINPKLPHLHNGIGVALLARAEYAWSTGGDPLPSLDQARASFDQAIAAAPEQAFGHLNLGSLWARRSRYLGKLGQDPRPSTLEAEAALRRGLEKVPGNTWLRVLLGTVYVVRADAERERGKDPSAALARAEEELRIALEKSPGDAETWLQLGKAQVVRARWHRERGRPWTESLEEAASAIEKAAGLAPDEPEYLLALAQLHLQRPEWLRRGLELSEQALKARPGWPEARALHATLRLELDEGRGEALEELRQALAANPNLTHEWARRL